MKKAITFISILLATTELFAASPVSANRWLSTHTDHFTIVFKGENREAAEEVASFCEEVYVLVTDFFDSYPPDVTVVLWGKSDSANGYYQPIPAHIVMYVAAPSGPWLGSKTEQWLRALLIHEFTHYVHLTYRRGAVHLLSSVLGPGMNSMNNFLVTPWMMEGVTTTNETRFTGGGRGRNPFFEILYKAPIIENRFFTYPKTMYSGIYPPSGRHYVAGYLLVDYIDREFGTDNIATIHSAYAENPLFGSDTAVKRRTKKNPRELFAAMKESLEERYRDASTLPTGERITPAVTGDYTAAVPTERGIYLYRSTVNSVSGIVAIDPFTGTEELLYPVALIDDFSLAATSDGNDIVFASYRNDGRFVDEEVLTADLYRLDRRTGVVSPITRDARLWQPAISPDGRLLTAVQGRGSYSALVLVDQATGETADLFAPEEGNVFSPKISPDGSAIVFALNVRGFQDIWILERSGDTSEAAIPGHTDAAPGPVPPGTAVHEAGLDAYIHPGYTARPLTGPDPDGEYFPSFMDDDSILFSSDMEGSLSLYRLDPKSGELFRVVKERIGAFSGFFLDGTLYYGSYSSDGYCLKTAPFDEVQAPERNEPGSYPAPFQKTPILAEPYRDPLKFTYWLPLGEVSVNVNNDITATLGAVSAWSSVLGKQSLSATFLCPADAFEPSCSLMYAAYAGITQFSLDLSEECERTDTGEYDFDLSGGLDVEVPFISLFELNRSTYLGGVSSFLYSQSITASANFFTIQAVQMIDWQITGLDSPSDIFSPRLFSGLAEIGYALRFPRERGEGLYSYGVLTGGIPAFFPHSTFRLSVKGAYRDTDLIGTRFIEYRGLFPAMSQSLPGELFLSGDLLFTIAVFDLPLLGAFYLQGIGGGIFAEFLTDWDVDTFQPDDRIHAGLSLTPLLGYMRVTMPITAGVAFRIPYTDIEEFDPSSDIQFFFEATIGDIDIDTSRAKRIR